ncbi:MAG TPA: aminotransferase class I/II-fold pyridoxal phosphate-dependent enzyme [Mycobacteriales bacterium]|nr:aminotransferase class I/II-fold pyridoxal phosphate-dependent enzyme [Mycobacteriales bacterium]
MQALILAAGMGRRLGALTKDRTKCMVSIHGRTLIERSLDALVDTGAVDRIVLVVGHGAQGVRDLVGTEWNGTPVSYVDNTVYDTTNNIHSLYLARDELVQDDTLLLESDLIYEPRILTRLIKHPQPNVAVVDRFRSWMDGTVVTVTPEGTIDHFVPKRAFDRDALTQHYKTVNIYKFSREYLADEYLPFLEAYVRTMGNNEYYEEVMRVIATLERHNLAAMTLDDEKWYEIDDLQDLRIAETLFAPPDRQYDAYLQRHGGYWRFTELHDFCYLSNPFFPPPEMVDELRREFDPLLRNYPSAAWVVDHLAAKMFGCDESLIAVGNGASEWITAIGTVLEAERVGVPVPTFEEYLKRFPGAEIEELPSADPDFGLEPASLFDLSDRTDVLVLVNPDNPTGRCLPDFEVLQLAKHMATAGKRLIVDESFVDFAEPDHCASLVDDEVLAAYPNMILVRSIGKTHGVPGCRLGVVATADSELLQRLRAHRAVWNINSFGEYFMQLMGRYEPAYEKACAQLRGARNELASSLSELPSLRVVPSHGNYLLCELPGSLTATDVAQRLLGESILVKDCTGKPGLEHGQFIRVAVKLPADNERLVDALSRVTTS